MARRTLLITYIAIYLLVVASIIRYVVRFSDYRFWSIALLLGYLILLFSEYFIFRRNRYLTYIYLLVQTIIICTLSLISPNVDYWTALFLPLVVQVMHNFPQRTGFLITGIFTVIMAILMLLGPGPEAGLPLIFLNGLAYFLFAAFIAINREAEAARREAEMARDESEKQQVDLQSAYRQLQSYTAQAEELAVLQERNRLARELHDSVTQSLYSLTLFSHAARRMAEDVGNDRLERQIGQIGNTAVKALKEMRLLVYELRPPELKKEGFIRALRQRLEAVEGRSGVEARLVVDELVRLPPSVEQELYRITNEALNNALKHAAAKSVTVYLRQLDDRVELEVVDDGIGFEFEAVRDHGGMGLESIRQRAKQMNGEATIRSAPGKGTSVKVAISLDQEQAEMVPPVVSRKEDSHG
jgi:signal transduction histidine kinase